MSKAKRGTRKREEVLTEPVDLVKAVVNGETAL